MKNPFISFVTKAFIILLLVFCLHLLILKGLHYPLFDNRIVASYAVNLLLIVFVFGMLFLFRRKYKSQLGFLFLAGSILKFAVFFILFYPYYKLDGSISKLEFVAFFTPYAIGLILETVSLSKWLNNME